MKKPLLHYLGKPEDGFGWGVANTNIVRALAEFCEVSIDTSKAERFDGPVFVPVADARLTPLRRVRAPRVVGYCFTEWPIAFEAQRNARLYDVLFAGSTWNVRRLAEQGIRAEVLHQGIDFERFKLQPPSVRPGFVIFSGGKYEFRKGQDYVAAAMRHFMAVHDDVVLMTAWHNQWPTSMVSMSNSWLVEDWSDPFAGLPRERVLELPAVANEQLPGVYAQAHLGVFPNRCEAGTNLVMCEFMACGRAVIASCATGHEDVVAGLGEESLLRNGSWDAAGWFNPNVSDLLVRLEWAYKNRDRLPDRGLECRRRVERFTWRACAERIARAAFPDLPVPDPDSRPGHRLPVTESSPGD